MMLVETTHPEDIKAAIRKKYRSVAAFERAEGLARQSVSEIIRGRPSSRTRSAIERVLQELAGSSESIIPVDTEGSRPAHRLNAGAR